MKRCTWVNSKENTIKYHDMEWGVPVYDDQLLFEYIVLDSFQAGLSWQTILDKRENFRKAFDQFDAKKIAQYDDSKITMLMKDAGIIRNLLKIKATISNAQSFLLLQKEYGSFSKYIWQFTSGITIINKYNNSSQIPVSTQESDAMSKGLKSHGFKFVGTTICYAFMQAAGMVNDHLISCNRYDEICNFHKKNI